MIGNDLPGALFVRPQTSTPAPWASVKPRTTDEGTRSLVSAGRVAEILEEDLNRSFSTKKPDDNFLFVDDAVSLKKPVAQQHLHHHHHLHQHVHHVAGGVQGNQTKPSDRWIAEVTKVKFGNPNFDQYRSGPDDLASLLTTPALPASLPPLPRGVPWCHELHEERRRTRSPARRRMSSSRARLAAQCDEMRLDSPADLLAQLQTQHDEVYQDDCRGRYHHHHCQ